jgi:hypothetical protein
MFLYHLSVKVKSLHPLVNIVQRLHDSSPGIAVEDIDLGLASKKSINSNNDLFADRRPSQYSL